MGVDSAVSVEESCVLSLRRVGQELREFFSGKGDARDVLRELYSAAPGRSSFLVQLEAGTVTSSSQKTGRSITAELSNICSLSTKELTSCVSAPHGPSNSGADCVVGPPGGSRNEANEESHHPQSEVAFVCICTTEFWLQFVQHMLALKRAVDSRRAQEVFDFRELPSLMENLLAPLSDLASGRAVIQGFTTGRGCFHCSSVVRLIYLGIARAPSVEDDDSPGSIGRHGSAGRDCQFHPLVGRSSGLRQRRIAGVDDVCVWSEGNPDPAQSSSASGRGDARGTGRLRLLRSTCSESCGCSPLTPLFSAVSFSLMLGSETSGKRSVWHRNVQSRPYTRC